MKHRTPWLYYLMVWVSGGLLWFLWPFLMARDVNDASKDYVPRLGLLGAFYGALVVLFIALVAYEMHRIATYTADAAQPLQSTPGAYSALLVALAILLFGAPAYLVAKTAGFIRASGRRALSGSSAVALFVFYGISLPILQSKLNALSAAQPDSTVKKDAAP